MPRWSLCEEEQTKVVLVLACAHVPKNYNLNLFFLIINTCIDPQSHHI